MIVSYKWLQNYFDEELPEPKELAEILTMQAFEVESVEDKDDDFVLDVDILPNRSHDSLSHRGIAKEISALLNIKMKIDDAVMLETPHPDKVISINVKEPVLCRRYVGKVIENVKVGPSPDWLKERLEVIGQKSINNIVDATNFVMFDTGQPLHGFDLDKLDGEAIVVRKADDGEKITTLDGKEVELSEEDLVIADNKSALAIAGVKGGKKAEVDESTTCIMLESANFEPVGVRKTSRRLNILTDSSKRFENNITPELAGVAMEKVALLIYGIASEAGGSTNGMKIGESVGFYPRRAGEYKIGVSVDDVNKLLGTSLSEKNIGGILRQYQFEFEIVENPIKKVLELAPQFVGAPYKYGASITYDAPKYFDCSSFTSYLFAQVGVAIPRISIDQFVFGEEIEKKDLRAGDLVFSKGKTGKIYTESVEFMKGVSVKKGISHCGIYTGDGKVVHSSGTSSEGVAIENMGESPDFVDIVGFRRIEVPDGGRFVVSIPPERLDLRMKTDLIEEIGRAYGYKNIEAELPNVFGGDNLVNKEIYYANKIRGLLVDRGFSEVYNYSLVNSGEVELRNPLASDKGFMRTNLSDGMKENLEKNIKNAPLLGLKEIKIFEFGNVFEKDEEYKSFSIGYCKDVKKNDEIVRDFLEDIELEIENELGANIKTDIQGGVLEINFNELVEKLPDPPPNHLDIEFPSEGVRYQSISQYPFMLRDIAIWVPEEINSNVVLEIIKGNVGELLVRSDIFDKFKKDGRVSYAFNLVFQSDDRTLTDDEVGKIMDKITDKLNSKPDWQVR